MFIYDYIGRTLEAKDKLKIAVTRKKLILEVETEFKLKIFN